MRKIISWFFIIIGLVILICSSSKDLMKIISDERAKMSGAAGLHWGPGGDLVNMAYLNRVEKFNKRDEGPVHVETDTICKEINLSVYGDSYVMDLPASSYSGISDYHFGRRDYYDLQYNIQPGKKNILIIENGERFIRMAFRKPYIIEHAIKNPPPEPVAAPVIAEQPAAAKPDTTQAPAQPAAPVPAAQPQPEVKPKVNIGKILNQALKDIFNPSVNQNMEYNLFNYNLFNNIRYFKAELNYNAFRRVAGDVALSEDGDHLLLRQTVDPHGELSGYEKISKAEQDKLFKTMETVYQHFKQQGFDEVYFTFIPNTASVLQPRNHNGILPAMEKFAKEKQIPVISLYADFLNSDNRSQFFQPGDTHWSHEGCRVWLNKVNKELEKQCRKQ